MNQSHLSVRAIKTAILHPGDSIVDFLIDQLKREFGGQPPLENTVLAITSKIVSLAENRVVMKGTITKEALVKRESDEYFGEIGHGVFLTIKHGLFIPSAGIDESNAEKDFYILFPEKPFESADRIQVALAKEFGLKNFGVLITDSKTTPLRAGVTGVSLSHSGFKGIKDRIGAPDLFGRNLKMTRINVADALAVSAVYCMGESNECTPLALITTHGASSVEFVTPSKEHQTECQIPLEQDLYAPVILKSRVSKD